MRIGPNDSVVMQLIKVISHTTSTRKGTGNAVSEVVDQMTHHIGRQAKVQKIKQ